jgi:hypothetical protein
VITDLVPEEGVSIEIIISLPAQVPKSSIRVQMRGKGTVVRVDPDGCFAATAAFRIVRVHQAGVELFPPLLHES